MQGNYDAVAPFYDRLSRLVFGNALYQSQVFLLQALPAGSKILIVGGGTGWILEEITKHHSSGLQITYVELSKKMLAFSSRRNIGENKVTFVSEAIQDASLSRPYDVVITPFLFDNFSETTLCQVFKKVDDQLVKGGLWLFADFQLQENKISHKLLLNMMYLFFGFLCRLETSSLPDSEARFQQHHYQLVQEKHYFKGFICSKIYRKPLLY